MMSARNQAEHGVIQSSIALLQERFKQLQRVKEMREKKELLTIFSDNYQISTNPVNYATTTTTNTNDGDVVDVDNDELQIFLPPNYYYSGRKPSCYSSSSSSLSSSSSVLSHNNQNYPSNLNEISLSLWPSAMSYHNATNATATAAAAARRAKLETPPSTMSTRLSSCVSSAYKFEDSHHVSDVDTTLHL